MLLSRIRRRGGLAATLAVIASLAFVAVAAAATLVYFEGYTTGLDPPPQQQLTEHYARYAAGEPSTRIAEDLGVAASTVVSWLREAGVTLRPRGPRGPYRQK